MIFNTNDTKSQPTLQRCSPRLLMICDFPDWARSKSMLQLPRLMFQKAINRLNFATTLAWRSIQSRLVQSLATVLVVGLALGLFVVVAVLGDGAREGITEAADPFGTLVIGPKGDPQQLVLSTILLNGNPLGTIDIEIYEALAQDTRAELTIPIAMADNVGGASVIGTTSDFFALQPSPQSVSPFQLSQGRYFEDTPFDDVTFQDEVATVEAVLGVTAAQELGLTVGDLFVTAHGTTALINSEAHDLAHMVVGILHQTNTAFDSGVFVPLASVWQTHADLEIGLPQPIITQETDTSASDVGELTAILVRPRGLVEANMIWQDFYVRDDAQAAFPGQELGRLFNTFRQLEEILTIVGYVAAVMAALTIFLAIYSATVAREQMIAVLRGMGTGRGIVLGMVLLEGLIIALLGALLARLLGYGTAWVIANSLSAQNSIPIPINFVPEVETILWLLPVGLGLLAGAIPALLTYRLNVVDKLFAS